MKYTILVLAIVSLSSCTIKVDKSQIESVGNFNVERLFTHEGCTAYRFNDGSKYVYYTNCGTQTQSTHSCGKNCTETDSVTTY